MQGPSRACAVCMSHYCSALGLVHLSRYRTVNHRCSTYGTSCQSEKSAIIHVGTFPTSIHGIKLRLHLTVLVPYILPPLCLRAFSTTSSEYNIHMPPVTPTLTSTARVSIRIITHHRARLSLAVIQSITPLPSARHRTRFSAHVHTSLHIAPTATAPDQHRHRMSLHIHQSTHVRRCEDSRVELAKGIVHLAVLCQRRRVVVNTRPPAGNLVVD